MSQPNGYVFRLDLTSGRFTYLGGSGASSPGDGCVVVTGCGDGEHAAAQALNTGAMVPTPIMAKWQVDYVALKNAIAGGTRAQLVPWTL